VLGTTIVVGTTFGVVAKQAGLEPIEIAAMSLLVFGGAAQFAMVQPFAQSAPVPVARRLLAAFFLTDKSFAMAIGHFRRGGRSLAYYVTIAVSLFVLWNLATYGGILLGGAIGDPRRLGVDFAITATFIGIVVLAIRRPVDVIIALVAALVAGGLGLAGASTVAVITAGAIAPLIAVFVRR
jgi:predicted branched-subunit amino acid permease